MTAPWNRQRVLNNTQKIIIERKMVINCIKNFCLRKDTNKRAKR